MEQYIKTLVSMIEREYNFVSSVSDSHVAKKRLIRALMKNVNLLRPYDHIDYVKAFITKTELS